MRVADNKGSKVNVIASNGIQSKHKRNTEGLARLNRLWKEWGLNATLFFSCAGIGVPFILYRSQDSTAFLDLAIVN